MALSIGDTFKDDHLWVFLNNPTIPDDMIVCVNLTSEWHDESCVLYPSKFQAHPDLKHPSYIRYDRARFGKAAAVEPLIAKIRRPRLDLAAVKQIQAGAMKTKYLKNPRIIRPVIEAALLP